MKFEPHRTYKTRSGEDALIYCVDAPGDYPVHGRVTGSAISWRADGWVLSPHTHHSLDLTLPEPERVSLTVYANVWPKGVDVYRTEEAANLHAHPGSFDPLRIAVPCTLTEIVPTPTETTGT